MPGDFDFRIGKQRRYQGQGWRGLAALGMLLLFQSALLAIFLMFAAERGVTWLVEIARRVGFM